MPNCTLSPCASFELSNGHALLASRANQVKVDGKVAYFRDDAVKASKQKILRYVLPVELS